MSTALDTQTVTKLKVPSLYKVVILNDDFTPMDFVIQVLMEIFSKSHAEAHKLCMDVHHQGRGICGTYSKEVAEQKVYETNTVAKSYKHPLKAIVEKA
jgi:ATP-dependent Clp protease adaptor protein ClpS